MLSSFEIAYRMWCSSRNSYDENWTSDIFSRFVYISDWIGQDTYLLRDELACPPVPDGYEADGRAGSDKITVQAKIGDTKVPTSIPRAKRSLVFSEGMHCARRQRTCMEYAAIPVNKAQKG